MAKLFKKSAILNLTISLDLTQSSEVRKAGDQPKYVIQKQYFYFLQICSTIIFFLPSCTMDLVLSSQIHPDVSYNNNMPQYQLPLESIYNQKWVKVYPLEEFLSYLLW